MAVVKTCLYYLERLPVYESQKPYYINWPVTTSPGETPGQNHEVKQTNLSHERFDDIQIHDIRGKEADFHIDVQGFQLVQHETAMSNDEFEEDRTIRDKYCPEMSELLKTTLGCSSVFIFEHTHRLHKPNVRGCGHDRKRQPLVSAHIDQTPNSSTQRVRYHLEDSATELLKNRFQVINIWRPLFGPLRDFPLTLGDFRTFDFGRDGEPTDLVFPHYVGESLNLYHHPNHQWHFISDQMRDEVWMFKCFDSKTGVASATPHCAFDIQKLTYLERPRESIEVRCLVFYDS